MAFIITVITGVLIGFIYDFFRVVSNSWRNKSKIKYIITDTIFWISAGIIMLFSFYYSNNMNLRAYQFLGTFTGVFIYFLLFSRLLININIIIYKIFKFFFKIVFTIVKLFVIILSNIFKWISRPFIITGKFIKKLTACIILKTKLSFKSMRKV